MEIIKHLVSQHKAQVAFVDIARPAGFWSHQVVIPKDVLDVMLAESIDLFAESKDGGDASRGKVFEMALKCGYLIGHGTSQRKARECLETILAFWNRGADLYAKTKQAAESLAKACELQQWPAARHLIAGGASPEARSEGGTALQDAVGRPNTACFGARVEVGGWAQDPPRGSTAGSRDSGYFWRRDDRQRGHQVGRL